MSQLRYFGKQYLEIPLRGCSLDCIHRKAVAMQERASRLEHLRVLVNTLHAHFIHIIYRPSNIMNLLPVYHEPVQFCGDGN